jgi:lactate dehydrogenase-like 2-hydroxyacid dehydrogenase
MVPLKIALRGKNNEFTEAILTAFRQQLPEDEMIFWLIGERAPAADCEAVLVIGTMGADEMDQLPELALIQTISDGYDAVDVDAATERGIWVSYSPGQETGNADSVAQYAVLLILAAARRLGVALRSMSDSLESRPMLNQSTIGMADRFCNRSESHSAPPTANRRSSRRGSKLFRWRSSTTHLARRT